MLAELVAIQKWIHDAVTADLLAFADTHDWTALMAVLPAGIVFGAVHALTPGHSKSVLASYLLGSRLAALRASAVAAVLSLTHVGSAVVVALVATQLVTRTIVGAGRVPVLEGLSRGLLVAIGLWLLWRAWRRRAHPHGEGIAGRRRRRANSVPSDAVHDGLRSRQRSAGGGRRVRWRHGALASC